MTVAKHAGTALILSIHRGQPWWCMVARNLGYERSIVVADERGRGDLDIVDSFYAAYAQWYAALDSQRAALLDGDEIHDVVIRCRVLRWLPARQARAMALAMADVFGALLDEVKPTAVLSWPIDCYVGDVLDRMASRRGLRLIEVTVGALPGTVMFLHRGKLLVRPEELDDKAIEAGIGALTAASFTPAYVANQTPYTATRFIKNFAYIIARSAAFRALSVVRRDPLNIHYLDARADLGHKPRASDIVMLRLIDADWQAQTTSFDHSMRLFMPLQLFPEASIDYWIREPALIQYEDLLVEVAEAFSTAGYVVVVKDHPLQFGYRQVEFIRRLKAIRNVVIVPYGVSGNALLGTCGATFSCTGTLGLQAALNGSKAVTTATYFTNDDDFVLLKDRAAVAELPRRVERFAQVEGDALHDRQRRIVSHLLSGSTSGDFMSFQNFNRAVASPSIVHLASNIGDTLAAVAGDVE